MSNRPSIRQPSYRRLHEVLRYDPDLGTFTWKCARPGVQPGREAGTIANGYRQIEIDLKLFRGGRLAWLYITGSYPPVGMLVDHANGNRADDRWDNLRLPTPQQNARNRGLCPRNKSGKVGVCVGQKPGTREAIITINNRTRLLGRFECLGEAVAVRCEEERHYFGDFARRVSR